MRPADLIRELRVRGVDAETILDAMTAVEEERRAKERARSAKYRNNNRNRTENTGYTVFSVQDGLDLPNPLETHEDRTENTRTPRISRTPPSPETKAPTPLKTQPLSPKENPRADMPLRTRSGSRSRACRSGSRPPPAYPKTANAACREASRRQIRAMPGAQPSGGRDDCAGLARV